MILCFVLSMELLHILSVDPRWLAPFWDHEIAPTNLLTIRTFLEPSQDSEVHINLIVPRNIISF